MGITNTKHEAKTINAGMVRSNIRRVPKQVRVRNICQVTSGDSRKVGKRVIEFDNQMMRKSGGSAIDEQGMTLYVLED